METERGWIKLRFLTLTLYKRNKSQDQSIEFDLGFCYGCT